MHIVLLWSPISHLFFFGGGRSNLEWG